MFSGESNMTVSNMLEVTTALTSILAAIEEVGAVENRKRMRASLWGQFKNHSDCNFLASFFPFFVDDMAGELWGFLDHTKSSGCRIGWSLEINDGIERAMTGVVGIIGGISLVGCGEICKKKK
ncbi:unnamed protein product [Onchocerca flexuosa]|uniref:Uncharacterized protein n=1 Tax=Onchocerca flexuosa TaxID=387005 RepID=A0A183I0A7_9BILA|nr:unnamed protein product [Onchocerca flexuosa]